MKVYHCNEWHNEYTEFYMKYDVDDAIAELKQKLDKAIAERDGNQVCIDALKTKLEEQESVIAEKDKFIADLEESHKKEVGQLLIEIRRLENLCASYRHDCDNLAIREANALKEIGRDNRVIRHNKYKRCLAMARWCHNESLWWYSKGYSFEKYDKFWEKWEKRWLKIAEKVWEA